MTGPGIIALRSRTGRAVTGVVVALAVVLCALAVLIPRFFGLPPDAALRVGDTVISRSELQHRVDLLGALYGIQPPPDAPGRERFKRDSAKAVAVSTVLDQAAAQRNIVVPDKTARDALAAAMADRLGGQGRDAYVRLLAESGASEDDALTEKKRQLANEQLFNQVTGPAASGVSDADVRTYFRDHPAEMVVPEQRHLRNIVVAEEAEANEIAGRIRAGADFGATAKQSTIDDTTRASGGDLGFIDREKFDPAYGAQAFAAPVGAVFGPVKTPNGFNIGQVLGVRPATPLTFEQVQQSLTERLRSERALDAWRAWTGSEVERADVAYADDYRPAEPDRPAGP